MKYFSMASLFIAGAMMFSCSNENDIPDTPQQPEKPAGNMVTLTTTISWADDSTQTRALTEGGVKTFAPNEKIAVVFETLGGYSRVDVILSEDDITNGGKTATIVNCNYCVNIRAKASSSSKKLGTADKGSTWTIKGRSGNWIIVDYKGETAYIYKKYVKVS